MLSVSGEAGVARWKMERTQTFVFSREQLIRPEAIPFLGWMLLSASCTFKVYPHYPDAETIAECSFETFPRSIFSPGFADNFSDFSPLWHPWPPSYNDPFVKIANFPRRRDKVAPFLHRSQNSCFTKYLTICERPVTTHFPLEVLLQNYFTPCPDCGGWWKVRCAKVWSLISF